MTLPYSSELRQLLMVLADGEISAAEFERLGELLRGNPEAQQFYVRYMDLHAQLTLLDGEALLPSELDSEHEVGGSLKEATQERSCDEVGSEYAESLPSVADMLDPQDARSTRSPLLGFLDRLPTAIQPACHPVRFFSVAMLLTLGFWSVAVLLISQRSALEGDAAPSLAGKSIFAARLIRAEEVEWAQGFKPLAAGASLVMKQEVRIQRGTLDILFASGARVVVEGPASLRIEHRNALSLEAGKMLARVSGSAKGFEARSPLVDVIDLGTEFGLHISASQAELEVFQGVVEARRPGERNDQHRRLVAGSAVVITQLPSKGFQLKEKKMNRTVYLTLAAVLSLPIANAAWGVPVTIDNPSFESPAHGAGGTGPIADWNSGGTGGHLWNITGVSYFSGAPDGNQIAYVVPNEPPYTAGYIEQTVGTVSADTIYTLTGYAGHPLGYQAGSIYSAELIANGTTVLASIAQTGPNGDFEQFSVTFDSTGSAHIGESLTIRLGSNQVQSAFDMIALDASPAPAAVPAPEPTTSAILGGGGLVLFGALRR